jgi:hypothetical protein
MYILHRRNKRTRTITALVVVVLIIGAAAVFGKGYFTADTSISPTPAAVVSTIHDTRTTTKHIDDQLFSFDVPRDWEATQVSGLTAGSKSWQNTKDNKGVRVITLYMDNIPANFAVNRVVALRAESGRLFVDGSVSDNCTNFTGTSVASGPNAGNGKAPAKWQGVNFICDTGNYLRNVVGTGSIDGLNTVKLTGQNVGAHNVFITYTDNSASPNFGIFTDMLQSFKLK